MRAKVARSGAASTRLTQATLETYGVVCWLQLPGCTMRATTKDHVVPVEQGGTDAIENLRPACGACNSRRRNLAIGGTPGGILVTFHIGPLATITASNAHAEAIPGHPVITYASLLAALTRTGEPSIATRRIAHRTFKAAVEQALRIHAPVHIRIAHPVPTPKQLQTWARLRYFTDVHDPGRAHAEREAMMLGHDAMLEVGRWYDRYPEGQASIERVRAHRPNITVSRDQVTVETVKPSRTW